MELYIALNVLSADSTRELRISGLQMCLHYNGYLKFNTNKGDIIVWIFLPLQLYYDSPIICRSRPDIVLVCIIT